MKTHKPGKSKGKKKTSSEDCECCALSRELFSETLDLIDEKIQKFSELDEDFDPTLNIMIGLFNSTATVASMAGMDRTEFMKMAGDFFDMHKGSDSYCKWHYALKILKQKLQTQLMKRL